MSFRVIAKGHHFAIYGEFAAAVRKEAEQLAQSQSGGAPLAKRSLALLSDAVTELLRTAPHECDVDVELWGERDEHGLGSVKLELTFTPAVAAESVTPKEALTEEHDDR